MVSKEAENALRGTVRSMSPEELVDCVQRLTVMLYHVKGEMERRRLEPNDYIPTKGEWEAANATTA